LAFNPQPKRKKNPLIIALSVLLSLLSFPSLGCPKSMTMNFWFSVIFVRFYLHHFCRRRLVSRVFGGDDAKPAEISFYLFSKRFSRHISIFSSHLLTANFASSLSIAIASSTRCFISNFPSQAAILLRVSMKGLKKYFITMLYIRKTRNVYVYFFIASLNRDGANLAILDFYQS